MLFISAQGGAPLSPAAARAWEEEARGMAWDLLLGLHALHTADVAHRDLKPANILLGPPVTDHALGCECKLCTGKVNLCIADFGLGRLLKLEKEKEASGVTSGGGGGGPPLPLTFEVVTPGYKAPELLCATMPQENNGLGGGGCYDGKLIDCWSAGAIVAEMLADFGARDQLAQDDAPSKGKHWLFGSERTDVFPLLGYPTEHEWRDIAKHAGGEEGVENMKAALVRDLRECDVADALNRGAGLPLIPLAPGARMYPVGRPGGGGLAGTPRFPALELISGLLAFSPEQRWDTKTALCCEWFQPLRKQHPAAIEEAEGAGRAAKRTLEALCCRELDGSDGEHAFHALAEMVHPGWRSGWKKFNGERAVDWAAVDGVKLEVERGAGVDAPLLGAKKV